MIDPGCLDLFPVSAFDARIADGGKYWEVLFELFNLDPEAVCYSSGAGQVHKTLGQLVHGSPHAAQLLRDLLGIQVHEWTWLGFEGGKPISD